MDWILGSSVLVCTVSLWWYSCVWWNKKKKMEMMLMASRVNNNGNKGRIPNGSLGWPLIGETLEFIACGCSSNPLKFMHNHSTLYGKVFKTHILGRPIIISSDSEVNKVVLQNDGRTFIPFYPRSIIELLGKSSILQISGNLHKRVHGLVGAFLKSSSLKEIITRDLENLLRLSFITWSDGQQIYMQNEAKEITFQALIKVLLGLGPGEEFKLLEKQFKEFIKGLICLPIKLPGTTLHKSLKAKQRIMKLIEKIIEEKMIKCSNCDENGELNDVVDVLLKQMKDDDDDDQNITIDFICSNITEMMIPGEDSVPMLITLALKFLGDSPSSLNQLKEENMELKMKKRCSGESYSWKDYMSLSFTQNVISETLRMGNIIMGAWRKALTDVEIKGYLIPKDWCIMACFSSIHLDQDNYEKPFQFDPWRWQKIEGSNQNNFTPFGGGQRLCPGQELSRLEAAIFLHHFVTTFSWVAEEDMIITFPTVKMKKRLPIILKTLVTSHV
ncbi:3-epi-6-deoxocathasterone 23-monooxygenase protein [Dioscorea alata]|uniref:3-epi-6-deoxocathasterone 23-monooxygenase protein n=1 Tax=Dioscorea alata TaxID=55571 RepID=A0ACB7UZ39_DIOAL|nr:3-epi-6-deoxocathasterone 23-monooxygenase protein [Dioscorea alata]